MGILKCNICGKIISEITSSDDSAETVAHCSKYSSTDQVQFCKKRKQFQSNTRGNEPPLPTIIGLEVHSKTRKKKVLAKLHREGLSVSYERILEIRSVLAKKQCQKFLQSGLVYPINVHNGIFVSGAIDNIDHNLTSATAKSTTHWTGISMFQHPDTTTEERKIEYSSQVKDKKIKLSNSYTEIRPVKPANPEPQISSTSCSNVSDLYEASEWLEALGKDIPVEPGSFSAFFSDRQTKMQVKALNSLLPMIPEPITSHATVRHCMEVIKRITAHLNPSQQPVIVGDQPVYALCKQVKLMFPTEFQNFLCRMGDFWNRTIELITIELITIVLITIELITIEFMFVRNIREGNFELYKKCVKKMLPWLFALDHTHYARWLTIVLNDLENIPQDSNLYKEFASGKFTVNKSGKKFSPIGVDQAHEQNNKIIKDGGGAVGIFDNEQAILQWALSGPVIGELLEENNVKLNKKHHEDTSRFEKLFQKDFADLLEAFNSYGNPFDEEEAGLVHFTSKILMSQQAEDSAKNACINEQ